MWKYPLGAGRKRSVWVVWKCLRLCRICLHEEAGSPCLTGTIALPDSLERWRSEQSLPIAWPKQPAWASTGVLDARVWWHGSQAGNYRPSLLLTQRSGSAWMRARSNPRDQEQCAWPVITSVMRSGSSARPYWPVRSINAWFLKDSTSIANAINGSSEGSWRSDGHLRLHSRRGW